jgi:hypothetical protein
VKVWVVQKVVTTSCSGRIIKPADRSLFFINYFLQTFPVKENLRSPERRLIELRIEHADLDALIDRVALDNPTDELMMRRLKKQRLGKRDEISRLECLLDPKEPA